VAYRELWKCIADDGLVKLALRGCREAAGPPIAGLIGKGFGISDQMAEWSKELIVALINDDAGR
jgi:hypothetical protein